MIEELSNNEENKMNEMRKLMEAVKQLHEETGGPFKNKNDAQTNAKSEIGGGKEGVNFKTYEKNGEWYWTEQVNEDYGFAPGIREVTNQLHELMDDGTLDPRAVADAALKYLSEDDVKDMAHANELIVNYDDDDEIEEDIKQGLPGGKPTIDLSGPDGNAFVLMGRAEGYAKDLGLDGNVIIAEMKESDYEHLLSVFDKYFGKYVDLYRG